MVGLKAGPLYCILVVQKPIYTSLLIDFRRCWQHANVAAQKIARSGFYSKAKCQQTTGRLTYDERRSVVTWRLLRFGVWWEDDVKYPETRGVMKPQQENSQKRRAEVSSGAHVRVSQLGFVGRCDVPLFVSRWRRRNPARGGEAMSEWPPPQPPRLSADN